MDLKAKRDELLQRLNQAVLIAEQLKGAIQILDEQLAEPPPNRAARRREAAKA